MSMHCINRCIVWTKGSGMQLPIIFYIYQAKLDKGWKWERAGTIACWRVTSTRDAPTQTNGFWDGFVSTRCHISHSHVGGWKKIQKELIWEQKFSKLVMEGWACKFYNVLLLLYDYLSTFIRLSHSDWHKRGWFLHLDYLFRLWSCWIHFDPIFNLIQQSGRGTDEWKWKLWNSTGNPNLDFIMFIIECKIKICQEESDLIGLLQ